MYVRRCEIFAFAQGSNICFIVLGIVKELISSCVLTASATLTKR